MKRIYLLILGCVSFLGTFVLSVFSPGSLGSKTVAIALCSVLGINSTSWCYSNINGSVNAAITNNNKVENQGNLQSVRPEFLKPDLPNKSQNQSPPNQNNNPNPNNIEKPDDSAKPTNTNSNPNQNVPSESISNESCNPQLMSNSAQPGTQVIVKGVPNSFNQIAVGIKTKEMEGFFPVLSHRLNGGDLSIFVPFHPTNIKTGGEVELLIANGNNVCSSLQLNIEPLAMKPENAGNTKKILLKSQSFLNTIIQTSNVDQKLLMGDPQNVPENLKLLSFIQWIIDHPQNPNSLKQIAENKAPILEGQKIDYQLFDNLLANTGLNEEMDNLINFVKQKSQIKSGNSSEIIGTKSLSKSSKYQELASLNSSLFNFAFDCNTLVVSNAQKLDDCMWGQKSWEETKNSQDFQVLVDQVKLILSGFAISISLLSLGAALPIASGIIFGSSMGVTIVEMLVEANVTLMPSELTKLEFTASPTSIKKDQSGTVTEITLDAKSGIFPFTIGGLVDLILNTIDVNKFFVRSPKLALSPYKKGIQENLGRLNNLNSIRKALGSVLEPYFKFLDTNIGGFGPNEYKNIKVDKNYVTSSVGPYGKIRIFGNNDYLGIEKGWTTLIVTTNESKFAGKTISKNQSIEVTDQDPPPPPPPNCCGGGSHGDPHLITFDGFKYDHQAMGEFILAKSTDNSFEVQVREAAVPGHSNVSVNSATAIKLGSDRVAFYAKDLPDADTSTPVRVNGKPTVIQGTLNLPGGGKISNNGGGYIVQAPTGEQVAISVSQFSSAPLLDISPSISKNRQGQMMGLLGNFNGNPNDDLRTRSGEIIKPQSSVNEVKQITQNFNIAQWIPIPLDEVESVYLNELHKKFGDSWRISQAESLFDYAPGKNTESFTNRAFPNGFQILRMLLPQQVQMAEKACREAKVGADRLEGCMFDVGVTGNADFAKVAANALTNIVKDKVEQEIKKNIPPVKIPGLRFP